MSNRQQQKPTVPAPKTNEIPTSGDAYHPPVNDNPGEAPQVQMVADAKAFEQAELEANKEASLQAEAKTSKSSLMVVATRAGFYKQSRKQEGDKFVIADKTELGDWMKEI